MRRASHSAERRSSARFSPTICAELVQLFLAERFAAQQLLDHLAQLPAELPHASAIIVRLVRATGPGSDSSWAAASPVVEEEGKQLLEGGQIAGIFTSVARNASRKCSRSWTPSSRSP